MLKRSLAALAAFSVAGLLSSIAGAAIYNDATGENFDGNAHLDITSVEVTNTATDISFKINVNAASITSPDWGKYQVGIDTNPATGDVGNPVGNPWGRNIRMGTGMDAWLGSWVDSGGGAQPWTFGAVWTQNGQYPVTISGNSTTLTVPLASLGLSLGQTINFDVYATGGGGGDSANDAAGNPNQTITNWPGPYDSGQNVLSYTIAVPEPATVGAFALAGLGLVARRRSGR